MRDAATLPLLLKQLGLPSIYANWEKLAKQAQEESWSYAKYLASLSEYEVAARYNKRVQRHTKESKLPPGKTLATFNLISNFNDWWFKHPLDLRNRNVCKNKI